MLRNNSTASDFCRICLYLPGTVSQQSTYDYAGLPVLQKTSSNLSPDKTQINDQQRKAVMRMVLPWQTPLQAGEPAAEVLPAPQTSISFSFFYC